MLAFLEKLTDVVGLYLNPPQQALVLCVDEKSQIQALDRTQPGLPLKKGRCGTMTHDYKRNGTTTLFAALEVLQGKVVGQCYKRHRQAASEASHPTFLGGAATSNGRGADSENGDDARTPPDHSRLSELKMQWISMLRVETRALFLIKGHRIAAISRCVRFIWEQSAHERRKWIGISSVLSGY